ncbi:M23 family metallopeptidase [bacterium]|nr:M23 family metallopeptidase [bacterium]MCI6248977.1 M23 family metallopeptidase [bacterium]MCI7324671.1 M23 family metallopeptidase [bacterium]
MASGVVTVATSHSSYGNYVMVYHGTDDQGNTYATLYAHMNSWPPVSVGQSVTKGQVIGYVGTTGNSTGNHLHLELRVNGARTNPLSYVPH